MAQDGEAQAWEKLLHLQGDRVAARASAEYRQDRGSYQLFSFGQELHIDMKTRSITSTTEHGLFLLEGLAVYSVLGVLHYLAEAKDILPTGTMVNPNQLPGGDIFQRGTHRLPLHVLADTFGGDIDGFLKRGKILGGEQAEVGDTGLTLFPFPRVPVTVALWKQSEEFPAEAALLFDSTCPFHLATDVIWATAMMTVGMLAGEVL